MNRKQLAELEQDVRAAIEKQDLTEEWSIEKLDSNEAGLELATTWNSIRMELSHDLYLLAVKYNCDCDMEAHHDQGSVFQVVSKENAGMLED